MGFFKSKEDSASEQTEFITSLLLPGEKLEGLFQVGIEFVAITDKRVILKDKDGLFDKSPSITSIPFSKISGVSFNVALVKMAPIVPTLKVFGAGISVEVKGLDQKTINDAYNHIMAKIL